MSLNVQEYFDLYKNHLIGFVGSNACLTEKESGKRYISQTFVGSAISSKAPDTEGLNKDIQRNFESNDKLYKFLTAQITMQTLKNMGFEIRDINVEKFGKQLANVDNALSLFKEEFMKAAAKGGEFNPEEIIENLPITFRVSEVQKAMKACLYPFSGYLDVDDRRYGERQGLMNVVASSVLKDLFNNKTLTETEKKALFKLAYGENSYEPKERYKNPEFATKENAELNKERIDNKVERLNKLEAEKTHENMKNAGREVNKPATTSGGAFITDSKEKEGMNF